MYVAFFISGCIGVYGFIVNGSGSGPESPLVWALEGQLAPFLWAAIFGLVIDSLWREITRSRQSTSHKG